MNPTPRINCNGIRRPIEHTSDGIEAMHNRIRYRAQSILTVDSGPGPLLPLDQACDVVAWHQRHLDQQARQRTGWGYLAHVRIDRTPLNTLRARARDLLKNNEYAAKLGRMVRNNVVGTEGFIPQPASQLRGNGLKHTPAPRTNGTQRETVDQFLARGGRIQHLAPGEASDGLRFDHADTHVPAKRRAPLRRRNAHAT